MTESIRILKFPYSDIHLPPLPSFRLLISPACFRGCISWVTPSQTAGIMTLKPDSRPTAWQNVLTWWHRWTVMTPPPHPRPGSEASKRGGSREGHPNSGWSLQWQKEQGESSWGLLLCKKTPSLHVVCSERKTDLKAFSSLGTAIVLFFYAQRKYVKHVMILNVILHLLSFIVINN